jgi:hypothetical protein
MPHSGGLQRKPSGTPSTAIAPRVVHQVLNSPGRPLDESTRAFFAPHFGRAFGRTLMNASDRARAELTIAPAGSAFEQQADRMAEKVRISEGPEQSPVAAPRAPRSFGDVRVHADAQAAESARAVNALAYTVGNHIVFDAGRYQPHTDEGRAILAHELTHVVQQGAGPELGTPRSPLQVQRKVAVDPAKFSGPTAGKDKADFEKMVVDELKAVTGMNLSFSSDTLAASGKPAGGSATAQQVLNMGLADADTIYIDPRTALGGEHKPGRGIEISTASLPLQLKSLRTGIIIIHELGHRYAAKLKPAGYDQNVKQIEQKAQGGQKVTNDEAELLLNYNPSGMQSDENIPRLTENKVQQELGLIKRIHYGFHIEFPPKPSAQGLDKFTTYAEFQAGTTFIYLDASTYDLFVSSTDYFAELVKAGKPATPTAADFKKVVKGSTEYNAIKAHLI